MTEAMYVATLRGGLIRGQLTDAIASGAEVPSVMRDFIYRYRGERRVTEYLRIPSSTIGPIASRRKMSWRLPCPECRLVYVPELRELTVISLDPDMVVQEFKPSDDEIKRSYDERLPGLSVPERRRVRHLLFANDADAAKAHDQLVKGGSFDQVAKEAQGQLALDTSLGLVTRGDLPPPLAEAAFGLAEGKPSDPVKDPLGWHILIVDKIEPGQTPSLESVRDEIVRELSRDTAMNSLVRTANKLEDELAGGVSLAQAADKLGLKAVSVGPSIPRAGSNPAPGIEHSAGPEIPRIRVPHAAGSDHPAAGGARRRLFHLARGKRRAADAASARRGARASCRGLEGPAARR